MSDISVGAVGAAIIAGLVSLLGLIIGKEQKVSEFRQAWIDELRKCLVSYLVNINAISDSIKIKSSGGSIDHQSIMLNYKLLNEANHGIKLRVNSNEQTAKSLLSSMRSFEMIANSDSSLTAEAIRSLEEDFLTSSKELLKFEWDRVKKGEKIFVATKISIATITAIMIAIFMYSWFTKNDARSAAANGKASESTTTQMIIIKPN